MIVMDLNHTHIKKNKVDPFIHEKGPTSGLSLFDGLIGERAASARETPRSR